MGHATTRGSPIPLQVGIKAHALREENAIRGIYKDWSECYRVLVRDGLWVVEGVNDYGGSQVFDVVLIVELKDGKMWRDRRYYAEPFEAPKWRAKWVERMES